MHAPAPAIPLARKPYVGCGCPGGGYPDQPSGWHAIATCNMWFGHPAFVSAICHWSYPCLFLVSFLSPCLGCGPCCQASMRSLRAEVEETLRPLGCEHPFPLRRRSPRSPRSRISFSLRKNQGLPEDRIRRDQQLAALSWGSGICWRPELWILSDKAMFGGKTGRHFFAVHVSSCFPMIRLLSISKDLQDIQDQVKELKSQQDLNPTCSQTHFVARCVAWQWRLWSVSIPSVINRIGGKWVTVSAKRTAARSDTTVQFFEMFETLFGQVWNILKHCNTMPSQCWV